MWNANRSMSIIMEKDNLAGQDCRDECSLSLIDMVS
jgi:hypothetical protein